MYVCVPTGSILSWNMSLDQGLWASTRPQFHKLHSTGTSAGNKINIYICFLFLFKWNAYSLRHLHSDLLMIQFLTISTYLWGKQCSSRGQHESKRHHLWGDEQALFISVSEWWIHRIIWNCNTAAPFHHSQADLTI